MSGFTYGPDGGATYGPDAGGTYSGSSVQQTGQRSQAGGTYGPDEGMTYGPAAGGVWSPGERAYRVAGVPVGEAVTEERTHATLTITVRVDEDTLSRIDHLQNTAEEYDRVVSVDGRWKTLDRASSDGTYTISPPVRRHPPRETRTMLVETIDVQPVEQREQDYEVTMEFVDQSERSPSWGTVGSRATDEWQFTFRNESITTTKVRHDIVEGTESGAGSVTLRLILDARQTAIVEQAASRLDAVNVREVPDGANITDDNSSDPANANTVTITTPDGKDPIRDGDWVVMEWVTERISDDWYRLEMELGAP